MKRAVAGQRFVISPDTFNTFVDTAEYVQSKKNDGGSGEVKTVHRPILARLTGSTQIGTLLKWGYDFTQVLLTTTGYIDVTGGIVGAYSNGTHAINLCEVLNVAWKAGTQGNGVKENRSGFPANFKLQPIGGEDKVSVIVRMEWMPEVQSDGTSVIQRAVFELPNAEDGSCS